MIIKKLYLCHKIILLLVCLTVFEALEFNVSYLWNFHSMLFHIIACMLYSFEFLFYVILNLCYTFSVCGSYVYVS